MTLYLSAAVNVSMRSIDCYVGFHVHGQGKIAHDYINCVFSCFCCLVLKYCELCILFLF